MMSFRIWKTILVARLETNMQKVKSALEAGLRVYLTLSVILLFTINLQAQTPPSIEWQKCLGGSADDAASSIHQTFDGGFIIAGHSFSSDGDLTSNHGNGDYWVVKLDAS